jgi:hypothetical protein
MIEYGNYIIISKETWEIIKHNPHFSGLIKEIEKIENKDYDNKHNMSEEDLEEYLSNLEDYEKKLAEGKINWK